MAGDEVRGGSPRAPPGAAAPDAISERMVHTCAPMFVCTRVRARMCVCTCVRVCGRKGEWGSGAATRRTSGRPCRRGSTHSCSSSTTPAGTGAAGTSCACIRLRAKHGQAEGRPRAPPSPGRSASVHRGGGTPEAGSLGGGPSLPPRPAPRAGALLGSGAPAGQRPALFLCGPGMASSPAPRGWRFSAVTVGSPAATTLRATAPRPPTAAPGSARLTVLLHGHAAARAGLGGLLDGLPGALLPAGLLGRPRVHPVGLRGDGVSARARGAGRRC